jgi:hypothetical protein
MLVTGYFLLGLLTVNSLHSMTPFMVFIWYGYKVNFMVKQPLVYLELLLKLNMKVCDFVPWYANFEVDKLKFNNKQDGMSQHGLLVKWRWYLQSWNRPDPSTLLTFPEKTWQLYFRGNFIYYLFSKFLCLSHWCFCLIVSSGLYSLLDYSTSMSAILSLQLKIIFNQLLFIFITLINGT